MLLRQIELPRLEKWITTQLSAGRDSEVQALLRGAGITGYAPPEIGAEWEVIDTGVRQSIYGWSPRTKDAVEKILKEISD